MKRLFFSVLLLLIASKAYAASIQVTRMDFYPPETVVPVFSDTTIGANPPAPPDQRVADSFPSGTVSKGFSSDVEPVYGESFVDGFFGVNWFAFVVWCSETPGANTWSGNGVHGAWSYAFNLAPGDLAFGLYFNWSASNDIPVLAIFHDNGDGTWSPVDTDGDGTPGTGMQTPPFPNQTAAFSGLDRKPSAPRDQCGNRC